MLLRAFSSGAVALSGVEAVSNGVPSFKKPESKNASRVLVWMGSILGICFLGVSVLASHLKPFRGQEDGNGLGLMAEYIYGGKGVMFWLTMIAHLPILILAANTAYAGFPGLASIIARDGYLPRQFFNRGARSGVLERRDLPGGDRQHPDRRLQRRHLQADTPRMRSGCSPASHSARRAWSDTTSNTKKTSGVSTWSINAVGAVATGLVALVVVVSKFTEGAWIPAVLIPIMVFAFRAIGKHYKRSRGAVVAPPGYRAPRETHTMVVLVGGVNKGVLRGVQYARSLNPDRILAVTVASNDEERKAIEAQWKEFEVPIELHTVYSPYRELTRPILQFIDELDEQHQGDIITVVIPEFVTTVGTQWLHNGSAFALKAKLLYRPHTAVVSVPIHTMGDETED